MYTHDGDGNRDIRRPGARSPKGTQYLEPWTLPLIVAAIIVPIAAGFILGGPLLGLVVGLAIATLIVVVAVRQRRGGPIESATPKDRRRHVLVVVSHELDDPVAIDRFKHGAHLVGDGEDAEVRVMAPAKMKLLDRWATDVGPAREEAQRKLVLSVASLEKADVPAEAAVGDEGIVQAVEDELRSFPATDVVLVTGRPDADPAGAAAADELESRLEQSFDQITVNGSSG
jgi:hypothetical protein